MNQKIKLSYETKSYETSKWYIKALRNIWYLYAAVLHLRNLINVELWIDSIISSNAWDHHLDEEQKKLRSNWKEIIRHVELSKMHKYTSRYERQD